MPSGHSPRLGRELGQPSLRALCPHVCPKTSLRGSFDHAVFLVPRTDVCGGDPHRPPPGLSLLQSPQHSPWGSALG